MPNPETACEHPKQGQVWSFAGISRVTITSVTNSMVHWEGEPFLFGGVSLDSWSDYVTANMMELQKDVA